MIVVDATVERKDYGVIAWWGRSARRTRAAMYRRLDSQTDRHRMSVDTRAELLVSDVARQLDAMERRIVLRRWKLDAAAEKWFWAWLALNDFREGQPPSAGTDMPKRRIRVEVRTAAERNARDPGRRQREIERSRQRRKRIKQRRMEAAMEGEHEGAVEQETPAVPDPPAPSDQGDGATSEPKAAEDDGA